MKLSETLATRAQHQMPVLETHADQARELEDTNAVLNDYINGRRPQGITNLGQAMDKIKEQENALCYLYEDRKQLIFRLESESSRADWVTRVLANNHLPNPEPVAVLLGQEITALADAALAHGAMESDYWSGVLSTIREMANLAAGRKLSPTTHMAINEEPFTLAYSPMKITVVDPLTP